MEHIVIQSQSGTIDDPKRLPVVCRCGDKRIAPYAKVSVGDTVYTLLSGVGIVSRATVSKADSFEYRDVNQVRELCKGTKLYDGMNYWNSNKGKQYATVIRLTGHEVYDPPKQPLKRSFGWSWIVLDSPDKRAAWLGK